MKLLLKVIILFLLSKSVFSQQNPDCYTIIVGKKASFDGSVLIGHNEDDGGKQMIVNWFKVGSKNYKNTDSLTLLNGTKIKQFEKTFSYIRFQVTKQKFGDAYLNENSVLICSDACASKEDTAKGNIGYYFREILAGRASSAKDAVRIGGKLIEELGYESSGRTYTIADKNEAWMLSIVKGKRWIAQRIPDDEVAIIPNYYTIQKVNLEDTLNFLSSPDIIDYAIKRGWYNPEKDKNFNFRKVYGDSACNIAGYNIPRHLAGMNLFQKNYLSENNIPLPFSFIPKRKIGIKDIKNLLSSHYEDTEYCKLPDNKNPHQNKIRPVCTETTQFSFVAQLRNNMPEPIGSLIWISPYNGCVFPYIPVYFGIYNTNEKVRSRNYKESEKIQFKNNKNNLELFPNHAYYIFNKYVEYIEKNYPVRIEIARKYKSQKENELFKNQINLEKSVMQVYKSYPDDTKKILTNYCNRYFDEILNHIKQKK
ncbi:MAG: C69 family dipeptidase [Bacteroidales bacterium]|nr:C69 family dipeptidase [Bacteroidales bacterium]